MSTAALGRDMVGLAWSPRGQRWCCTAGASSARCWIGCLTAVRGGQSRVLVVSGEPGVGKTALLQSVIQSASGFRVVRAVGVESEMELAFAALQQLCAPMLDRLDRLPAPQQDALGVAFGLRAGNAPDRFLVGLAVLSLLAEVAEEQPLLCVVDDAQWLDRASAQALVFVARRLLAESVALVLVTRSRARSSGSCRGWWSRVCVMVMRALCWARCCGVPLDERVRERIVAETRGNPLALLELPRGLTAGGAGGRVRFAGRAGTVGADRGQLSEAGSAPTGRYPAAVAGRGGGAGRRPGAGVAGGRAARDRAPGSIGDRRVARDRRARDLSSPVGPLGCVSRGVAARTGRRCIARWPTRPTLRSIPIAAPGILPKRRRGSMRTSPLSSSARRAALRRAEGWRQRPRSWNERPPDARALAPRRGERSPRHRPSTRPARSTRHYDWLRSQSPDRWTSSSTPRSTCSAVRSRSR